MYYVYVIKSGNKIYIGHTVDLMSRLKSHNLHRNLSTKTNHEWKLVHQEVYQSRSLAMKREVFLKTGDGRRVLKSKITGV